LGSLPTSQTRDDETRRIDGSVHELDEHVYFTDSLSADCMNE